MFSGRSLCVVGVLSDEEDCRFLRGIGQSISSGCLQHRVENAGADKPSRKECLDWLKVIGVKHSFLGCLFFVFCFLLLSLSFRFLLPSYAPPLYQLSDHPLPLEQGSERHTDRKELDAISWRFSYVARPELHSREGHGN